MSEKKLSRLELIQAKRAARHAAVADAADEQRATDLEAIFELEGEFGVNNVSTITIPHTEGLPVIAAVRCPKPIELKRYRERTKVQIQQPGQRKAPPPPDMVAAAEEIASVCVIYPDREMFDRMCEDRPGLLAQAGTLAVELALGKAEEEGKG